MTARHAAWLLLPVLLAALAFGSWLYFRPLPVEQLVLKPAGFAALPGWKDDRLAEALPALLRSCSVILKRPKDADLGIAGTPADWQPACAAAERIPAGDDRATRAFLEAEFRPFAASNDGERQGLFTGYFEVTLHGSRQRDGRYKVPLYLRPPELVTVDLGLFRPQFKGQRLAGKVVDGALKPYASRAEIEQGALKGRGLELLWVDDPIDAFFLQIQGSGQVQLDDGSSMRVGYAAQNGHPYVAIGRELIERGALSKETVSMQGIRAWLAAHPDEAAKLMDSNPSYVFFRNLGADGPKGAEGVVLSPGRSLAVDRKYIPLGLPIWLDATRPAARADAPDVALRRLLLAQDTGGAIRGPVRGDVFWGQGDDAAAIAGRMKHPGRYWLLLPKAAAAKLAPAG